MSPRIPRPIYRRAFAAFIGINMPFTLALIAGLLSFVPYLGPVLALVPALLIAFAESTYLAGSVILLYAFI